jgi:hypothetical protein
MNVVSRGSQKSSISSLIADLIFKILQWGGQIGSIAGVSGNQPESSDFSYIS